MSTHNPDHDAVLQRLTCEPAPLPAELAACPTCRERWREVQTADAGLRALAAEQRAVLAEADAARGTVGEDLVADLIRAGLRERGRVSNRWPWFAVAAAVVIAVWLWSNRAEPTAATNPPDVVLNDRFEPTGRGVTNLQFRWPGLLRAGESFILHLLDDPADPLKPAWRAMPCETNEWTPDAVTAAAMQQRNHWMWRVERVGPLIGGQRARVELSELQEFWFSR